MVKLVAFFKRKRGITVEQFQAHWRTTHAELVVRQRGLRRYVQNHTLATAYHERGSREPASREPGSSEPGSSEPNYDGVAEAWFDDTHAMRELGSSAEYRAVREDESNFIDAASMGVLITDEVVIVDGAVPQASVKMIAFLNKRSDVTVEFFQRYWRETHGPFAARIPGNRRYVQCHARLGIYAAGRTPVFDGIPISWFDDVDALRESAQSAEYAVTRADEQNFMVSGRLPHVIAAAHEIEV
jgi:uncharacterized protein (TIGR02118 family)